MSLSLPCWSRQAQDTSSHLVIVIMVKNEAPVIRQTLQPFVDAGLDDFLVLDTGSTDDTVACTKRFFEQHHICHGIIKHEAFVDFSTSRNRALQLAEECFPHAGFMLMLDAEWYMHDVASLIRFCADHQHDSEKSYLVRIMNNTIDFWVARLMRCRCGVRFVGAVHEVLDHVSRVKVPDHCFFAWSPSGYGQDKTRQRWVRDCGLLLKEYERNPSDPRTVFYLAQTYACLADWENARSWYERRVAMPGWDEENFVAHYRLAQVYEKLDKWDLALVMYLKAFSLRPWRAEPLVRLAQHYWNIGSKPLCCLFAQYAAMLPYPEKDILFVEKKLYNVDRFDLLGRSADTAMSKKIVRSILEGYF